MDQLVIDGGVGRVVLHVAERHHPKGDVGRRPTTLSREVPAPTGGYRSHAPSVPVGWKVMEPSVAYERTIKV